MTTMSQAQPDSFYTHASPSHKKGLTVKDATALLKSKGFTLRWTGDDYRLCPKGESEEVAYYTDDLQDAIWTAHNWNGQAS